MANQEWKAYPRTSSFVLMDLPLLPVNVVIKLLTGLYPKIILVDVVKLV
jgi:hypothetical protein